VGELVFASTRSSCSRSFIIVVDNGRVTVSGRMPRAPRCLPAKGWQTCSLTVSGHVMIHGCGSSLANECCANKEERKSNLNTYLNYVYVYTTHQAKTSLDLDPHHKLQHQSRLGPALQTATLFPGSSRDSRPPGVRFLDVFSQL
jgi:hypothetical protein